MKCALCDAPVVSTSWLYYAGKGKRKNERVRGQVPLCERHGEMIFKHLKRAIPASLFTAGLLALCLLTPPVAVAQTAADTANTEMVRLRGFIRAAETQATKVIDILSGLTTQPEGPPTVQDWRTGEWDGLIGGYRVAFNLSSGLATVAGITAPFTSVAADDTLRMRLAVPGYENKGVVELVHAEGRMIGTVTYDTITRPASAQRPNLLVVRTVRRSPCTFAQYTDGSWGISPNTGECHAALDTYAGPLKFVARVYEP